MQDQFDPNFKSALELTAAILALFTYNPLIGVAVALAIGYYLLTNKEK
ncbi:MAG: hypothetical protein SAJ37_15600 [Oscillatoria sp. PMC 1068.18]|nr:hypothetical protein [Oscillatoria sp. PMC 1068.18]